MSTIDTSTWNPDPDFNESLEGIPLTADAPISQTWEAIRFLMAGASGDRLTIEAKMVPFTGATSQEDGTSGFVPAPEAGDEDKVLYGNGTWGNLSAKADDSAVVHKTGAETISGQKKFSDPLEVETINAILEGTTKGTSPSSAKQFNINVFDGLGTNASNRFALLQTQIDASGVTSVVLRAYKNASGETTNAALGVYYDAANAIGYTYAPTPASGDSSTKIATTKFVSDAIVSGNAGSATEFASAQTVALTGDVTGSASSKAGWSVATTLANSGVTAGTYSQVTVDAKGRVTAGNRKHSYTTAANQAKAWLRIANANTSPINPDKPLHAQFFIRMNASAAGVGYWQSWFVDVEVCGSQSGIRIFGNNSTAPFAQARVLYENTTASVTTSVRPAIDIYLNYVLEGGSVVEVEEVYNSGFDFVADGVLADSVIPSGYENRATAPFGDGVNYAQYAVYTSLAHTTLSANTTLNSSSHTRRPISCTGTITLTLPSINSTSLWYLIKNYGTGVVTLHPTSSSVYIDEVSADITLQPGEYILLACKSNAHYAIVMDGRWMSQLNTLDNELLLVKGTADNCYAATTAHQLLIESLQDAMDTMLKTKIYPVGSTFFSLTDSRNPATILGFGTWAKIEGQFLLGASSSYAADSTGGEASHTLTESEMPQHYHDSLRFKTPDAQKFGCNSGSLTDTSWRIGYTSGQARDYYVTGNTGGSQAHNNMPPYLAGYLWRRTA